VTARLASALAWDTKSGKGSKEGALAIKLSSGRAHEASGWLLAIVGQVRAPVGQVGWFSYGGTARIVLAVVLVAVAAGVAGAGLRLRVPLRLPSPGRTARTVMLATWGSAIVAFVVCFSIYVRQLVQEHLIHSRPSEPVLPVTAVCMIALFCGILYIGRPLSQEARLRSQCQRFKPDPLRAGSSLQ